ncbi:hypothetical protein AFLA_004308 [Aspergillus flavus NRRL3357]|nr:hypothetical protein AFLA_004308 [Aspergillus flavus NRRL3357]
MQLPRRTTTFGSPKASHLGSLHSLCAKLSPWPVDFLDLLLHPTRRQILSLIGLCHTYCSRPHHARGSPYCPASISSDLGVSQTDLMMHTKSGGDQRATT